MRSGDSANTPPCEPQMYPGFGYGCAHCGQLGSGTSYSPVMSPAPPLAKVGLAVRCWSDARGASTRKPAITTSQAAIDRVRLLIRTLLTACRAESTPLDQLPSEC